MGLKHILLHLLRICRFIWHSVRFILNKLIWVVFVCGVLMGALILYHITHLFIYTGKSRLEYPYAVEGIYVDSQGYAVLLRKNNRYRMCDVKDCVEGEWYKMPEPRPDFKLTILRASKYMVTLENVYTTPLGQRFYSNVRQQHRRDWHMPWRADKPAVPPSPHLVGRIENCLWLGNMPCFAYGTDGDSFRKAASFVEPDPG